MTSREKTLAMIVGAIILVVVNLFLFNFFMKNYRRLKTDFAAKKEQLEVMHGLYADREMWDARDGWLKDHFPKLQNESTASPELLERIKNQAKTHSVQLENPSLGVTQKKPNYTGAPVTFDTKSTWHDLSAFLFELQNPEQFIVVESVDLKVHPSENTQMQGKFRVAKWFSVN
jgi:Tfp pilus assembly protein PilO